MIVSLPPNPSKTSFWLVPISVSLSVEPKIKLLLSKEVVDELFVASSFPAQETFSMSKALIFTFPYVEELKELMDVRLLIAFIWNSEDAAPLIVKLSSPEPA